MTYAESKVLMEQAEAARDEAEKEFERIHKGENPFPEWNVFMAYMKPYYAEIKKIKIAQVPLVDDFILEPYPEYGDYFTMKQFKVTCECGGFIDYDGYGNLCIGDKMTNIEIWPSIIMGGVDVSKFDGVIWYNK
jgi:hypothetical protein